MKGSRLALLRTQLIACALAAGAVVLAPSVSAAAPTPEYQYFALSSVSLEAHGTYHEHYTDPTTNDEETADLGFAIKREFTAVEWLSNAPAPSRATEFGYRDDAGTEHLEASGTYEFVNGSVGLKGQTTRCTYSAKTSEPFADLLEIETAPEESHILGVHVTVPLGSNVVARSGEEPCDIDPGVGTSGPAQSDSGVREAVSRLIYFLVGAPETRTFPLSFSKVVEGDDVSLDDELTVKTEPQLLPPPIATPPKGPLEKIEPSTPITPPTTPPKPPIIPEPELGPEPPIVTGGGGPPKVITGITTKCPKGVKECKVTGIVEGELPIGRRAQVAGVPRKPRVRRVVLGRVSFSLAGGAAKKVAITLSKSGAAFVRAHPGVRAKILVTVTTPGSASVARSRFARLRIPARRSRR